MFRCSGTSLSKFYVSYPDTATNPLAAIVLLAVRAWVPAARAWAALARLYVVRLSSLCRVDNLPGAVRHDCSVWWPVPSPVKTRRDSKYWKTNDGACRKNRDRGIRNIS